MTRSLAITWRTWFLAVWWAIPRAAARALLEWPSTMSWTMSRSRWVRVTGSGRRWPGGRCPSRRLTRSRSQPGGKAVRPAATASIGPEQLVGLDLLVEEAGGPCPEGVQQVVLPAGPRQDEDGHVGDDPGDGQ